MSKLEKAARDVHDLIASEIPHKYPEGRKWAKLISSDAFRVLDNEIRPADSPEQKEREFLIKRLAREPWSVYTNSELLSACNAIDEIGKEH